MRLYTSKTYTVCTADGELIAVVSREQRNRLLGCNADGKAPRYGAPDLPLFPDGEPIFNPKLIAVHKKNEKFYFALVDPSIIRAELNREISNAVPVAEDCRTVRRVEFSNEQGAGRYFEHHDQHAFIYPTTEASAADRVYRHFLREKRSAHLIQTVCTGLKSDFFPLRVTDNVVTIPVRTESELPEAA